MIRVKACLFLSLLFVLVATNPASAQEKPRRTKVYAIAYQAGSLLELKEMIEREDWIVTIFPRWARKILVAIWSNQTDPLYSQYKNWRELEESARKNNDKNGRLRLIYIYNVETNGEISLEKNSWHNPD